MNEHDDEEDSNTSTWNGPIQSSSKEGFESDSTAFPVMYMKEKLENIRKDKTNIKEEDGEPNIFEQTNYKNIEMFMTIGTVRENLENVSATTAPVSKCDVIAQNLKDKKNPAKELKQIFIDCCDGVAAGLEYGKTPENLNGDMTDKKSEKYITAQNSRWLQSRMGEYFVLMIAMVMTFSVMFYSSKTFKDKYYNPMEILTDIQDKASWIQPLNSVLDLFLQDVTVPFIFLLSLGINTIPDLCNKSGLTKYPHFIFIVVFGIFFGLVWAMYQDIDWFLDIFFTSFEWKMNMIMFVLVLVHILINIIAKMINPKGLLEPILYRPKEFGGLFILFLIIAIRIVIALFLIPIAQMCFGFGFLFLFFVFPLFIGFLKKGNSVSKPEKGNADGSQGLDIMNMAKMATNVAGQFGGEPGFEDVMKMAGPLTEMAGPVLGLLGISTKSIFLDSSDSDEKLTLLDSTFPILFSIPLLLKFSKIKVTNNSNIQYNVKSFKNFFLNLFTNWDSKYQKNVPELVGFWGWLEFAQLFLLRNIVPLILAIYFSVNMASAAKYALDEKLDSDFFKIYTSLNGVVIFYLFLFMLFSYIFHILLDNDSTN